MAYEIYSTSTKGGSTFTSPTGTINNLLRSTGTRGASAFAVVPSAFTNGLRATSNRGASTFTIAPTLFHNLLQATSTLGGSAFTVVAGPDRSTIGLVLEFSGAGVTSAARLTSEGSAMSLRDVVNHILSLWGRNGCCLPDLDLCLQDEVLACVHHGLQAIFTRAHTLDYFNRGTITLTVVANTSSIALPQNVQTLLGPVRLASDSTPMQEVADRAEFDAWLELAYGGASHAPDAPRAYHLLKQKQSNEDIVALTLLVTPQPTENTDFNLDVATEPPRYTWLQVSQAVPLQVPHRYVETILLPIALKIASSYRHFTRREMQPQIDEAYARAREVLGLADPQTPARKAASSAPAPASPPP